ncbi:MAG: putative Ig domain-containing protein, partial [Ignavibacteriales bacterium]|nr:putative Ig domain-containing protein [Ignavibacteriales bacterium]
FEVGTANGYSPAILSNVSGSDLVTTKATQGAHSPAFSANSLQRYWTLTKGAGLTQSDLEFDYLAGDVVGTETNYGIRKYSGGSWSSPGGTVDAVNHKLTIAGVTSFSDWSAGECATITFDQSSPLPQGNQGAPYSQTLTVTGGSSPYSFAVTSGSLPTGLSLSSGGAITGTPTGSGTSNFDVTVTDASGCTAVKNYDLTITGCPVITVSPTSLPNGGGIGAAYDQTFTASGGTGPYTFAVTSGTLPGGLTLESDGHLHGTFTNAGVFNFTVTATDANTCTGSRAYTLVVCESMTFSSLPNGTIGVAYNQTISITSGGTAPYSFTVTAGVLPNGLSMGSDGHITGTPSALGTFDFTVTVTDANGCSDFHAYSVMISCPTITVNPASLPNGRINVAYSQTITASGGTGPYSFTVTSGSLPTGLSLSLGGSLSGTPSAGGSYTFTVTATDANSCTGSRSYTVIIDAPVVFKIAAGPGISPEGTNGVNAVDTLDWRNKATWVIESGVDADSIPDDDDVVLDNSHRSGSYVLRVGTVGPDSCRTITVGYAGNPNTITLLIPKTSTVTNALKFGTNGPGNYDMVIDSGGIVQNSSGKTSGTALNIRGFAAAGDSVLIKPGGKYLHNSKSSVSGIIIGMSKDLDAPGGTFEMDLPGPSSNTRFITMAGGVFPDLILSARDSAITYSPSTSQASAFGSCFIKGTFTVNAGATFLAGTSGGYEGDIFFKGNIVNNSTINFSSNIQNVLAMVGASAQTISGNAITLGKGMFVGNSAGVSLSTDVTVTGGTVQTTGMITYKQPELPGNTFNINAAGVLNTGSSTVFINPGGSMNEGDNPVVGNVSATRTASQSVNETFGSIGYEINAAGGAPGATTILRKTGVASTGNGHQSILRYFDVSPANNSGLNAAISFFYAVSELNGIPENTLILQKSTDGGTTWTGKSGSVNTGLHKIASTGINSFSRWTAAGSGTPLFVSHTITLRKFADADGDPNTTIDQTAKKWRMTLFVDSIAANDTVASANLNSGVLTVQNLEAGTYIAVEQDSTSSGWIRLGRRHNGTLIVGDSQYDTLVVSGGVPGTVDFINQKVSSIMVEKIVDHDGDPNTTGDQVSANWHLELYKGSVAPGNLVTSGDGQSIFASGLQAGIYIACESDSGASWVRINGNHTRYDTLIVTAGSSLTVQFINFRPNTIVVRKFQDNDGLMITEGDRVPKSWYLEVRNDNPSGAIVASGNTTALTLNNVGDGTYYASEGDSADWIHIVSVVNGSNHFPADHYQFSVANGQSVTIDFINAPPIYSRSFRTFDPDSIAFDKDNKGKVGKFVKRKDDKVQVKLRMQAPNAATGFTVKFSMTFTGKIYTDTLKSVVLDSIVNSKEKAVTVAVDSGHVYQLDGWGSKGVQIKGQVIWLTSPKQTKVDYKDPALFALNQRRLPMPNRVNVLFETFAQGGFAPNGLLVGKDRSADSGKQYGWLLSSKYREVLSTLYEKGQIHKGKAHGFDRTTKGKAILKRQKTMKPSLYDNELTAELVALKVNIAASVLVKTPNGFGELLYDDGTSNPLNGKMVKDISTIADSIMMGYYQGGVHTFADSVTFANLLAAVENINNSFEGAMDTNGFAVKLETKGTKQLIQVPYLHWNPSAIPALIAANGPIVETPMAYQLYQNYPNPFNPTTTIQFDLPDQALVTVKIYNILGQEIATLLDHQLLDDGTQEVEFNAQQLASGVYFYRIVAEGVPDDDGAVSNTFQTVKKMMLIK